MVLVKTVKIVALGKLKRHYDLYVNFSSEVKDEKRPWILRAKEASVQIGSKTTSEDSQALPETLIYISCGWESFKEVLPQLKWVPCIIELDYILFGLYFFPVFLFGLRK